MYIDTILKYGTPSHRWDGSIGLDGKLKDLIGVNDGILGTGVVIAGGGIQGDRVDFRSAAANGVNLGKISQLNSVTKFTLLFLVTPLLTNHVSIFQVVQNSSNHIKLFWYYGLNRLYVNIATSPVYGSCYASATSTTFPVGREQLVAVVYDGGESGANKVKIFFGDPGSFRTVTVSVAAPTITPNLINYDAYMGKVDANGCDGYIDEAIVLNDALTETQLKLIAMSARNTKFILAIGQSNANIQNQTTPNETAGVNAYRYDTDSGFVKMSACTSYRSLGPKVANDLAIELGCSICIIHSSVGGTGLVGTDGSVWGYRNPLNHADVSTLYGRALSMVLACDENLYGIICFNGETDALNAVGPEEFRNAFILLHSWLEEDLNAEIPMFYNIVGKSSELVPIDGLGNIRLSQITAASARRIISSVGLAEEMFDSWHYTGAAFERIGGIIAKKILNYYGGPSVSFPFFQQGKNESIIEVMLANGTDFTPISDFGGFEGYTGSEWIAPVSVIKNNLSLTLSFSVAVCQLRYMWGKNPDVSSYIKDNGSLTLPIIPYISQFITDLKFFSSSPLKFGF